jgi:hypothetical protein
MDHKQPILESDDELLEFSEETSPTAPGSAPGASSPSMTTSISRTPSPFP